MPGLVRAVAECGGGRGGRGGRCLNICEWFSQLSLQCAGGWLRLMRSSDIVISPHLTPPHTTYSHYTPGLSSLSLRSGHHLSQIYRWWSYSKTPRSSHFFIFQTSWQHCFQRGSIPRSHHKLRLHLQPDTYLSYLSTSRETLKLNCQNKAVMSSLNDE